MVACKRSWYIEEKKEKNKNKGTKCHGTAQFEQPWSPGSNPTISFILPLFQCSFLSFSLPPPPLFHSYVQLCTQSPLFLVFFFFLKKTASTVMMKVEMIGQKIDIKKARSIQPYSSRKIKNFKDSYTNMAHVQN